MFAGINPGEESARAGRYYAHPGNGFWPALSASGLVPRAAGPADDRRLAACCGIGFTDVVKRVATDSATVAGAELRAAAPAFRRRIAYASPRAVCFTTTRAFDVLVIKLKYSMVYYNTGHIILEILREARLGTCSSCPLIKFVLSFSIIRQTASCVRS